MKKVLFPAGLLGSLLSGGQVLYRPVVPPPAATAAYSGLYADLFSARCNPASLAVVKTGGLAVYAEKKFQLKELNHLQLTGGLVTGSGNFALAVQYAGFAGFHTSNAGIAYGRMLGEKVSIGAEVNYHSIRIPNGYGRTAAISCAGGMVIHLTEKLHTGFRIHPVAGGSFSKGSGEKLATVYGFGVGYDASARFFMGVLVEKEEGRPVNIEAGMEYRFAPQLRVKAGIAAATGSAWLGTGVQLGSFQLDICTGYHLLLGLSPGLSVVYPFKTKP